MGRRQQYVYHILPEVFPEDFPDRLDRFRWAAGFTWGGLARELRVNARTVRRWKAGSRVGSGHLVSLFALAARLGLLHHLLPEAGEPVPPLTLKPKTGVAPCPWQSGTDPGATGFPTITGPDG